MIQKFEFCKTDFDGAFLIKPFCATDVRGAFIKDYSKEVFEANGLEHNLAEVFYTVSHKGVIRALHFQRIEPIAHCLARQIHIGRGLQQRNAPTAVAQFGSRAVASRDKRDVGRLGQGVQHFETYVVAGLGILGTDIAQSYNQVFHLTSMVYASAASAPREARVTRTAHTACVAGEINCKPSNLRSPTKIV